MKSLVWLTGLVLFLCATSAAFVLVPPPGLEDSRGPQAHPLDREEALAAMRSQVAEASAVVEALLDGHAARLEKALAEVAAAPIEERLREWEAVPGRRPELESDLAVELGRLRDATGLEGLVLATSEGRIAGPWPPEGRGRDDSGGSAQVLAACEPFFREGRTGAAGVQLPAWLFTARTADLQGSRLALCAGRPLWARPDAPLAVLLGARPYARLEAEIERTVQSTGRSRLQWHLFSAKGGVARVEAGRSRGALIRSGLLRDLEVQARSERPAFTQVGEQVGLWQALRAPSGELAGGWGVTVAPEVLKAALVSPPAPPGAPELLGVPGARDVVITGGLLAAGLAFIWLFLLLWARFAGGREGRARVSEGGGTRAAGAHASRNLPGRLEREREGADGSRRGAAGTSRGAVREVARATEGEIAGLGAQLSELGRAVHVLPEGVSRLEEAVRRLSSQLAERLGSLDSSLCRLVSVLERSRSDGAARLTSDLEEARWREEERGLEPTCERQRRELLQAASDEAGRAAAERAVEGVSARP